MNIIRNSLATMSAIVLSLGFALPVAALNVDGTVNSATQGTVNVGGTGVNAKTSVGVDVGVGGSAGTQSSSTTSGGSAQTSGDANATMETNATAVLQALVITRADVDAGSVQATVSSPSSVRTQADLSGYVAGEMKADTNISSVEAASDNVAVTYKQHAKLFGFIPVTVDATANVDASGNVKISYPWYAFLMATNKADLEAKIKSNVKANFAANAGKNGIVSGNASATGTAQANANANAQAAAQLSADAQARIIAAVRAAMQAQLEAGANASANGNANVQ